MTDLSRFERITRAAFRFTEAASEDAGSHHAFDIRNLHPSLPRKVKELFDDGHYADATLKAFIFVDEEVQRIATSDETGFKLMMQAFGGTPPPLALNALKDATDESEQEGFKFLFAGSSRAIRNPRAHKSRIVDDVDLCLDQLSFASMLLRRLDDAGLR